MHARLRASAPIQARAWRVCLSVYQPWAVAIFCFKNYHFMPEPSATAFSISNKGSPKFAQGSASTLQLIGGQHVARL